MIGSSERATSTKARRAVAAWGEASRSDETGAAGLGRRCHHVIRRSAAGGVATAVTRRERRHAPPRRCERMAVLYRRRRGSPCGGRFYFAIIAAVSSSATFTYSRWLSLRPSHLRYGSDNDRETKQDRIQRWRMWRSKGWSAGWPLTIRTSDPRASTRRSQIPAPD